MILEATEEERRAKMLEVGSNADAVGGPGVLGAGTLSTTATVVDFRWNHPVGRVIPGGPPGSPAPLPPGGPQASPLEPQGDSLGPQGPRGARIRRY